MSRHRVPLWVGVIPSEGRGTAHALTGEPPSRMSCIMRLSNHIGFKMLVLSLAAVLRFLDFPLLLAAF